MDMFQDLLAQNSSPQVSPEMLEVLGNKAAQMFLQKGISLNEAVKQVSSEDPNLGDEHLRRIIEFANNHAFQHMFENSEDKNIHFDVADPATIIRDLKDGGSPAHDGKPLGIGGKADYQAPPTKPVGGQDDMAQLSQLFAAPPSRAAGDAAMAKAASSSPSTVGHANPIEDVYDTNLRLRTARSELAGANEEHDGILKVAQEEFYSAIKREVLSDNGAGLGGILGALAKVAAAAGIDNPEEQLVPAVRRLLSDGVRPEYLQESLEKQAGKILNTEHPLVTSWAGIMKAASSKRATELALAGLDAQIEKTAAFLKSKVRAV